MNYKKKGCILVILGVWTSQLEKIIETPAINKVKCFGVPVWSNQYFSTF